VLHVSTLRAECGRLCRCRRVLIAGLSPGQSYMFTVRAENGVSDQSIDDRQPQRITVSTRPAGA